jgi:HD-GYP domain-containing protein (c-di-GMP phosphodiesterase class II)
VTDEERVRPPEKAAEPMSVPDVDGSAVEDHSGFEWPESGQALPDDDAVRLADAVTDATALDVADEVLEPASAYEPASMTHDTQVGATISSEPGDTIHYSMKQQRRVRDVLTRFSAVRRAARFYPLDHPAVTEGVYLLSDSLRLYLEEGVDVQLAFYEGEILLGAQLMTEESVLFDQLVRDMMAIGVGSLVFRQGMTNAELGRAVAILASDTKEVLQANGIEHMVEEADLPHIQVGAVRTLGGDGELGEGEAGEAQADSRTAFTNAVSLIREMDALIHSNHQVSAVRVKGVVRSLVDNVLTNRYAMLQLTGLKNYDEYTFYHSANVAILSLALGSCITHDYRFLSSLGVGALLHDIGKLTVDLSILNKPGPLTPEEWAAVRQHPVTGAEMTALLPGVDKASIVTILEHHMRWDGTGYPLRSPRRKQHLASRIVAVADSYDAMTSRRSYSAARVQDEAMLLLAKSSGSSLDPALVRLFVGLMGLYPPRSAVRLSDGSVGIVLAPGEDDPLRPVVRRIADSEGVFLAPEDIDLLHVPELSVKACIDPRLLNIEVDDYV